METEKISALIINAIKQNDLIKFIERKFPACFERSFYSRKIVDIITHTFPQRINERQLSKELNISQRWLQKECKKAFGITYNNLAKIIRVYQALSLLNKTTLDNYEIALQLNYANETNMTRDFKKVLNITPYEAKKQFVDYTPEQLFYQ
jgi:AraC-like DNA-binding protein